MKLFLRIFATTLLLAEIFTFCGGIFLFDFSAQPYVATAVCAFVFSLILYGFWAQSERIESLEKRLAALEQPEKTLH